MKKKLLIVIAVLLVLCVPATAFAYQSNTPSKTTDDTTTTDNTPDFVVKPIENSEASENLLKSIFQLVNEQKDSVVNFFDDAVKQEISEKLPGVSDLTKVQMNEFVTIKAFNYEDTLGDRTVNFSFATNYTTEQKLVAMVAIFNADGTVSQWVALDAVVVDGKVAITFPQSLLEILNTESAALAILSV